MQQLSVSDHLEDQNKSAGKRRDGYTGMLKNARGSFSFSKQRQRS